MPNWQLLFANVAVVTLFVLAWGYIRASISGWRDWQRHLTFGALMGAGAFTSMLLSTATEPGILVDLRLAFVALAGLFGGPLGAAVATTIAAVMRATTGGTGLAPALAGMAIVAAVSVIGYWLRRNRPCRLEDVIGVGIASGLGMQAVLFLPLGVPLLPESFALFAGLGGITALAIILGGLVLIALKRSAAELALFRAALLQAPDFFYIKDTQSRFLQVNRSVSDYHGFAQPQDMIGKTDFDIADHDYAAKLAAAEQRVLAGTGTIHNYEEAQIDANGRRRWFSTTKAAVHDDTNRPVGIVGITRDITEFKELHEQLRSSREVLAGIVAEMTDGVAVYDRTGTLLVCNERYRLMFPRTGHLRLPGVHISTILEAIAATGEQLTVPEDSKSWIAQTSATLLTEGTREIELFDGRWLLMRRKPMSLGGVLIVVSDITESKLRSDELKAASEVLMRLASIDSLTGLANRRVFDERISDEVARANRNRTALSLLLIDVDHFKSFNDTYGHQAGDRCLQVVARCVREVLRRPADLAARYGGEEFAAILPETDEDGAYQLAQAMRAQLLAQGIAHSGSPHRLVTVSIGVATCSDGSHSVSDFIDRADEALYAAKTAGRNRTAGWREAHSLRELPAESSVG